MQSMKKNLIVILIAMVTVLMILPSISFAGTTGELSPLHEYEVGSTGAISPIDKVQNQLRYAPCPAGGKHIMIPHGRGTLNDMNGNRLFSYGIAHQCSGCKMIIVSEFDPEEKGKLGTYGVKQMTYIVPTSYYMSDPDYVSYNSSTSPTNPPWDSYVWY